MYALCASVQIDFRHRTVWSHLCMSSHHHTHQKWQTCYQLVKHITSLIKHQETEWDLAQQWEQWVHPSTPQIPSLPFSRGDLAWEDSQGRSPCGRIGERRDAGIDFEGNIWSDWQAKQDFLVRPSATITFLFANIWQRFWRKTELEVRNTDPKHVPGWPNWHVHK